MNRKERQLVTKHEGLLRVRDTIINFILNICFFAFVAFLILYFLS
ncbi:hypothetical protein [Peribacillus tepidiphilus]|nr:hypothetical protein [Peribacillus tepidiphilus]